MSFYGHIDEVTDAQFSIDGKLIISSSLDRTVRVFKPKTGEEQCRLEGHKFHQDGVLCFRQHHTRKMIITGGMDNTCCMSNYETGEIYQRTEKLSSPINSVCMAEVFNCFMVTTLDGYITLLDFDSLKKVFETKEDEGIIDVTFDEKSRYFVASMVSGEIILFSYAK